MTGSSPPKDQFTASVESLLKIGTIVLGLLYVLGLLVSNVQLMEVGVSDFASLQARNIMTGFLFILYCVLLILWITPLGLGIYLCGRTVKSQKYKSREKTARV